MRFLKPEEVALRRCADGVYPLAIQYVNWWAYQKGYNTFLKDTYDRDSDLFFWAWHNQGTIIMELADMVGIDISESKLYKSFLSYGV